MKKIIIILIAIIIGSASFFLLKNYYNNELTKNTNIKKAPNIEIDTKDNAASDFTLSDLDGNSISLSSLKGKKVFLNFWATWCPPCRSEMPDIEKLYQESKDSDIVILAVNLAEDIETVKNFIKNNNYNFKVLLDTDGKIAAKYKVNAIPTSVFINSEGKVSNIKLGAMSIEDMKKYIESIK